MQSSVLVDLLVVAAGTMLFFAIAAKVELSERVGAWTRRHESWQVDELPLTLLGLCVCLAWFGWRRLRERSREMQARVALEAAMQHAMQNNRELARQLLRLQERERSHIARELHDELAQQCVGIRVEAAGIEDEARARDLPDVINGARAIRDAVDRLHCVVRDMLTRLRPPVLDALGMEVSLRALAGGWSQRHGIACSIQIEACSEGIPDEVQVTLYRVMQEALTNVAQHAHASEVRLALKPEGERFLRVVVEDNGRGIAGHRPHAGLGLVGMEERVAALGGTFGLEASPLGGLRITVRVPASLETPQHAKELAL